MPNSKDTEIRCSFCGRGQDEVSRLIEGPDVFICDSCINFCSSLLLDDENAAKASKKREKEKKENSTKLQKPNKEAGVYNNHKKCD